MQCFEEDSHLPFLQSPAREKLHKFISAKGLTSTAVMIAPASLIIPLLCVKEQERTDVNKCTYDISTVFKENSGWGDVWVSISEQSRGKNKPTKGVYRADVLVENHGHFSASVPRQGYWHFGCRNHVCSQHVYLAHATTGTWHRDFYTFQ